MDERGENIVEDRGGEGRDSEMRDAEEEEYAMEVDEDNETERTRPRPSHCAVFEPTYIQVLISSSSKEKRTSEESRGAVVVSSLEEMDGIGDLVRTMRQTRSNTPENGGGLH